MKYLLLTTLMLMAGHSRAQDRKNCATIWDTLTHQIVYTAADMAPANEGGEQALYQSLQRYAKKAKETPDSRLKLAFVIEDSGVVSGGRILQDKAGDAALSLLNVIRSFKWQPGRCAGKAVPVLVVLPLAVCYR